MSEIKVENQIVMKKIFEIKPYVRNPRKNDKTVELLCKIIPKVGFNVPLVIDENGVIVKGHARFTAAIRLGMQELPASYHMQTQRQLRRTESLTTKYPSSPNG